MPTVRQFNPVEHSGIGWGSVPVSAGDTMPDKCMGLYIESSGAVNFTAGGKSDTWEVPDNFIIPIAIESVGDATAGTTATGLHAILG